MVFISTIFIILTIFYWRNIICCSFLIYNIEKMNEQINKYFNGELSFLERLELLRKIRDDKELEGVFIQYQNLEALLSVRDREGDCEEGRTDYQKFISVRKRHTFRKKLIRYSYYAATVIIILACGWISATFYESGSCDNNNEIYAPAGQRACVTLNDGTIVWLNACSRLTYPSRFKGGQRKVTLVGEAFFDVAKNPSKPFIVSAGALDIRALGTKFNVFCHPKSGYICTSLLEGSVAVYEPDKEKQGVVLKPENQACYQGGKIQVKRIGDLEDFSWKEGIYSFHREPLGTIVQKLGLYFDTSIQISDTALLKKEYTGKFRQVDGIDEILRIIQKIHPFKIKKDTVTHAITITQ